MLSVIPKGSVCMEVGVFMADFAREIKEVVEPEELVLVDQFEGMMFSCDEHGGNPRWVTGDEAFRAAVAVSGATYKERLPEFWAKASFLRGRFDFIYIDADHSYQGVKADLAGAMSLLKPGGWLGGHDYSINQEKCVDASHYASFGVKQAVDELGIPLYGLAMDGYTSFLLQKPGASHEQGHS
jgi:hypothetical protein